MSNRARARPAGGGGGQIQFTKRVKIAHPMERVLDGIQKDESDRSKQDERQKRYMNLLEQFQQLPPLQRKEGREDDLLVRFEKQTEVTVERTWCSTVMAQAFPVLKDNAQRSKVQKEKLVDMQILMCSAAKVFLAELIETARAVQHEENLVKYGVHASMPASDVADAIEHVADADVVAAAVEHDVADADIGASAEVAAASGTNATCGDVMDERALFLRAVAASIQAGKKDIEIPLDAQHIREAFRRLMEGASLGGAIPCVSQPEYSFLNEFCHFGDASLRDAVGASGGAAAADLDGEGEEADA